MFQDLKEKMFNDKNIDHIILGASSFIVGGDFNLLSFSKLFGTITKQNEI